jgi:hypothetical protein
MFSDWCPLEIYEKRPEALSHREDGYVKMEKSEGHGSKLRAARDCQLP